MSLKLTRFQREEVGGLLDVCRDEYGLGNRKDPGWGTLVGDVLTVTNRTEACQDLRDRADFLVSEGDVQDQHAQSLGYARSLRMLADRIETETR